MNSAVPPEELWTERNLLRVWRPDDVPLLRQAIDTSLPELLPWIPWAKDEPTTADQLRQRLEGYRADFSEGGNALYAVVDPGDTEIRGGIGFYRRVGPGALELGYWIRSDLAGRGLMTEATGALTEIGLGLSGIQRLEIRLDPANRASAAIPRRLGYRHRETLTMADDAGGVSRETMIWELDRDGVSARPVAPSHGYLRSGRP